MISIETIFKRRLKILVGKQDAALKCQLGLIYY